ncbi:AGAP007344-PA [Anopheles gambiae str. PEST]|uniref:AGAP007344-PA n=1 Tax=Anopheles gambiae TaxID=7165 RepID=Q7QJ81_ANOGA|nr:lysozyme c-1-like [Anopheles gambiae]AAY21241.1 lysozyme c-8 [Anopheles gambiae]EAA04404.3 AGAP007344-PA [Anopheles gambiae str. PEST]
MKLFFVTILLAVLGTTYGKVFNKCELVRLLAANGFPRSQLQDWICLIQNESRYDTSALNTKNRDGSKDYGIFQINNYYWCAEGKVGANECKLQCSSLRDDNIADDMRCALFIYRRHQFNAWNAWKDKCRGKPKPSVDECFAAGK